MLQFKNDVEFRVAAGDRIGWNFEGSLGIISFQYVEEHKTYFRKVENTDFPIVQNTYTFDNIHLPSIFSVAVQIDPSKYARLTICFLTNPICDPMLKLLWKKITFRLGSQEDFFIMNYSS